MAGLFKNVCYKNNSCKNYLKSQMSNLQVGSTFKLIHFWKNQGIYLFLPKKNGNNSNMTQKNTIHSKNKIIKVQKRCN